MTSFPPSCQLCVERGIVYQSGDKKLCIAHNTPCCFLCAFITTPCIFSNIFKLISLPISFKGKAGIMGKAKNSKQRMNKHIDMKGSYLSPQPTTSSTVDMMQGNPVVSPSPNQDVISLLHRINQPNRDLIQRVERIEKQNASMTHSSSPVTVARTDVSLQNVFPAASSQVGGPAGQQGHPITSDPPVWRQQASGVGQDAAVGQQPGTSHRPPPTLEAVRSSDISKAVTHLLTFYNEQAEMDVLQDKDPYVHRKSGRNNVTDTTNVKPKFKWPNEDYINSNVKKSAYDEMNMAQWVAGQLHNISQVEDRILVKLMLQQVTLSIRDVVAIPWAAVRTAWGVSMTHLEEGRLQWSD